MLTLRIWLASGMKDMPPEGIKETLLAALSEKVTPGLDILVEQHKVLLEQMETTVLSNYNNTQNNIRTIVAAIDACTLAPRPNYTTEMNKVAKVHRDCRVQEARFVAARDAAVRANATQAARDSCRLREQFRILNPCDAVCANYAKQPEKFYSGMAQHYRNLEIQYGDLDEACARQQAITETLRASGANLTAQRDLCNQAQREVDRTSCQLRSDINATCSIYNQCYDAAFATYAKLRPTWQRSESGYKLEMESILEMRCTTDALVEADDEKREQLIETCKQKDYSFEAKARVSLDYGKPRSKQTCALPSPTAGTQRFQEVFYAGVPPELLIKNCTASCCR